LLDQPVFLIERSPSYVQWFTIHTRHPLTQKMIFSIGEDHIEEEPLRLLLDCIRKEVREGNIWVMPYCVTGNLHESSSEEDVSATITKVLALLKQAFYPNKEVVLRGRWQKQNRESEIDTYDDDYGWQG
jgi:hypothetical protein